MKLSNYRPAPHVLDRLKDVDLVVVVGPTSVGKTTMMEMAAARYPDLHFVLNDTSRAPRQGEREGTDYNFKTREEMEKKIRGGGYVQVAPSLFGDLYATAPQGYSTEGVSMLAVLGEVVPLFRSLPFKSVRTVFVVPSTWEEWQRRLESHKFTTAQLGHRLNEARESLHFALDDKQTEFVISGFANLAAEDFATIALNKPYPDRLLADQSKAKKIAGDLLDELG